MFVILILGLVEPFKTPFEQKKPLSIENDFLLVTGFQYWDDREPYLGMMKESYILYFTLKQPLMNKVIMYILLTDEKIQIIVLEELNLVKGSPQIR
jgi:hypothetical protein